MKILANGKILSYDTYNIIRVWFSNGEFDNILYYYSTEKLQIDKVNDNNIVSINGKNILF